MCSWPSLISIPGVILTWKWCRVAYHGDNGTVGVVTVAWRCILRQSILIVLPLRLVCIFIIMGSCFIKFLSFLNMCTGVCAFILQIASLARFSHQSMERVGVGIWAGLCFILTGTIHWISASKEKSVRLYNRFEVATAVTSFIFAIVMVGIFARAVQNIVNDLDCFYFIVRKEHCNVSCLYSYQLLPVTFGSLIHPTGYRLT